MIKVVDSYDLYHVVFTKAEYRHWLLRLLDPNFQHCYVIGESYGGQYWKVINNHRSHLQVDIEPKSLYPTIRDYCGSDAKIVTVHANVDPNKPLQFVNIFTCVDVVKGVLGINSFLTVTPKQLFRRLINEQHSQPR